MAEQVLAHAVYSNEPSSAGKPRRQMKRKRHLTRFTLGADQSSSIAIWLTVSRPRVGASA
jgi:hypothetical protein